MAKRSAGLLLYRYRKGQAEVFLVHMGGPFWKNKDKGAWTIPKGEYTDEDPLLAAKREFREETGLEPPEGPYEALEPIRQSGGKVVQAFRAEGNVDPKALKSNTFEMEWPPKSGRQQSFPEVDRGGWFTLDSAMGYILKSQRVLLEQVK